MKKLLVFGVLLLAVVFVFGCTNSDQNENNEPLNIPIEQETDVQDYHDNVPTITLPKMSLNDVQDLVNGVFNKSYTFRSENFDKTNEFNFYYAKDVVLYEFSDDNLLMSKDDFLNFVGTQYRSNVDHLIQSSINDFSEEDLNCASDTFKHMFYDDTIASIYVGVVAHKGLEGSNNDYAQNSITWTYFWVYCSPRYVVQINPNILGVKALTGLTGWVGLPSTEILPNLKSDAIRNEDYLLPQARSLVDVCSAYSHYF